MKIISLIFAPVKWVLKFLLKCALILALVLIIILACGNFWLPWVTDWQVHSLTGFSTSIQSSRGSLFKGYVDFRDMTVKNPTPQFQEPVFISFNDLGVDVDLSSLFKDTIVLESVVVDINNISIVKDASGNHNYSVFIDNIKKSTENKSASDKKEEKSAKDSSKPAKNIHINKLVFAINSVKVIDEKSGSVKEYSLKYRREFSDISDISSIVTPLIADLSAYGLGALIESGVEMLGDLPGVTQAKEGIIKLKDTSKDAVKNI